jgi:hypothetical protein
VLANANRRRKGKSTNPKFRVSSQLSPLDLGTERRKTGEGGQAQREWKFFRFT